MSIDREFLGVKITVGDITAAPPTPFLLGLGQSAGDPDAEQVSAQQPAGQARVAALPAQ